MRIKMLTQLVLGALPCPALSQGRTQDLINHINCWQSTEGCWD
jgi:hypothetical protein